MVHHDIKPANILLDAGHALVADFFSDGITDDIMAQRLTLLSALLFTALDLKDRAFQELHRAFELREPGLLFLKVAPWLDPLRTDPRYGALVEKLGLG